MKTLVVGSMRKSAGKTSVIAGLAKVAGRKCGYIKPFGDRLLYKKKRLWDYDAALMVKILELSVEPESITLGFEHAKLKYMYTPEALKEKLAEMKKVALDAGAEMLFAEGGRDLSFGRSRGLDSLSLAKHLQAPLLLILHGEEGTILDDAYFIKKAVDLAGVELVGLLINQVKDTEEFESVYLEEVRALDLEVLGVLPERKELRTATVGTLAEVLFAKVVAGEENLSRRIGEVLVGAMSVDAVLRLPAFKAKDKLVITSGDRSDMILAALESGASGIVMTNNLLPPGNIIARAAEAGIPLLQVPGHTYQVAKQIDEYDHLLSAEEPEKIELLASMLRERVRTEVLL